MQKYLLVLLVLTILALWPFFKKGYYQSHDGEWMVIRFTAFHQALTSGQFPVRYVERLNHNYGYPVLNFLYPMPFYLAEIPKLVGFGFVDSIKNIFITSTITSVLAMYWALSQIFSKNAAFAGAIIYLFVPYRFVDLYVRGSLGESLAFTFVPIILGSIFKLQKGKIIYAPVLSLAVGPLILSHNVIAALFIPFLFLLSLFLVKNIKPVVAAFVLGVVISAFFTIPAIFDLGMVRLSQIKVSEIENHLVDFSKLLIPSYNYGPNPNSIGGMSVQIGIVTTVVILATIAYVIKYKLKNNLIFFLLAISAVIIFLNTKMALPLWQAIPLLDTIQFPWRMHAVLIFIAAYLASFLIDRSNKKTLLASLIVAAAIISTITYTKPVSFVDRGDLFYSTNEDTTNVRDEYLPLWVKTKPQDRAPKKIQLLGDGQITQELTSHLKYNVQVDSPKETILQVNTIYFPKFEAKIDGKAAPIDYNNDLGVINLKLPSGKHEAIIKYTESPVHLTADLISLLALFATGGIFYFLWRKQNS